MHIHFLQHVPFEGLASIRDWIGRGAHEVSGTHLYAGDGLPRPDRVDLLIVMGGPMGVHDIDAHPWLTAEKAFLRQVIDAGGRVLGICLGAQLIADVLGARVYRNGQKEIGWFPVTRATGAERSPLGALLPERFDAFHWHGDTFDLPPGATHLAASARYAQQIFLYGDHGWGFQCHPEVRGRDLERWFIGHACELAQAGIDVNALRAETLARAAVLERAAAQMWRRWLGGRFG